MAKRILKRAFNIKHVGGLLFFRIGRFGGSFYITRPCNPRTATPYGLNRYERL